MKALEDKIREEGTIEEGGILKVDSFLNHQLDVPFLIEIAKEFKKLFNTDKLTKILTIETSGIAIASIVAQQYGVPVLFARKTETKNLDKETYERDVYSYTKRKTYKIKVSKKFLTKDDHVLVIDDFLANGEAALGLIDIVKQSGATFEGLGIVIEKGFQKGGQKLREEGINLKSLAIVDSLENNEIKFREI
ncbi:xanthine phosphoribosyltransferase Xpt [Gottschalkia acidurici 9a]|uniref:Xanthine phosphoribosyltransferase n=1 Tax=Gottschalkia acidurici (strain ATCC 7906 / DSM 604 / BCRC 14475 / CIP 104303 / KCTC 5404 / NCIMB 10678 / 9a) TaxID=1128398 RepID=K0AZJ1_GOTA9|nr:xanthine phosphoribosyltransferase [Gottschalkia acidurici]AFS78202.1 xanthine phosphoribosyltransferase Xpt [Gottschalkia acidurici 9a]